MKEIRENVYVDWDGTAKCDITNGHCIRDFGESCKNCEEIGECKNENKNNITR